MDAKQKLLVVDDEQVVLLSCRAILEKQGFEVETTDSPHAGLKLAAERRYAAILLDIMMPGMNGLEFLERLRSFNATVPVVIITGYASVSSAAEAMRLHASDYVPKPFTPAEIIAALRRSLSLAVEEPAAPAMVPESWDAEGGFLFLDQAWMQRGRDGTVLAGAFLSRDDGKAIEALRLPPVGALVREGLPLAEFVLAGGRRCVIPAPASGEVIKVNKALADEPRGCWDDPCARAWLARIRPAAADAVSLAGPRRVLLACADDARGEALRGRLVKLGCDVHMVRSAAEVVAPLRASRAALLLVDGSLGEAVPALLDRVAEEVPGVKAVVVAPADWPHQAACRQRKLAYYGVDPLGDDELIGVLDAAFRPAPPAPAPVKQGTLPDTIRVIRITNRNGAAVALVATEGSLHETGGVGALVVRGLRDMAVPVRLTLGSEKLSSVDLWQLAQECDRGFVVMPQDAGRVPGVLVRESTKSPWSGDPLVEDRIVTMVVQSGPGGTTLDFDPRTNDSLARLLLARLAAARKS